MIYPKAPARPALAVMGVCALALMAPGFGAQAQEGPLGPMLECADIQDNAQRLACYDERVGILRESVRAGDVVAVDRPAVEAIERDGFGFNLPSLPRLSLSLFSGGSSSDRAQGATASERGIATADSSSGVEVVERSEEGQVERVLMTIARVDTISPNQYRFSMENGQVWTQVETGRRISTRAAVGAQAEIRRAAMGSYLLRINGEGQAYRVARSR